MSHGKAQTAIAATKTNIKTRKWQEWGSDISRQSTDQHCRNQNQKQQENAETTWETGERDRGAERLTVQVTAK